MANYFKEDWNPRNYTDKRILHEQKGLKSEYSLSQTVSQGLSKQSEKGTSIQARSPLLDFKESDGKNEFADIDQTGSLTPLISQQRCTVIQTKKQESFRKNNFSQALAPFEIDSVQRVPRTEAQQ